LSDTHGRRRESALRLIAVAFILLAAYLSVQATWVLVVGHRAGHSHGRDRLDGADGRS